LSTRNILCYRTNSLRFVDSSENLYGEGLYNDAEYAKKYDR
jgi:hypothetical protein